MMPICAASCTCVNPRSLRMRARRFPRPSLPKSIGGNFRVDFFGIGAVYGLELKTLEAIRYDTLFTYTVKKTRKALDRVLAEARDRKSTRLNSSHRCISYA